VITILLETLYYSYEKVMNRLKSETVQPKQMSTSFKSHIVGKRSALPLDFFLQSLGWMEICWLKNDSMTSSCVPVASMT